MRSQTLSFSLALALAVSSSAFVIFPEAFQAPEETSSPEVYTQHRIYHHQGPFIAPFKADATPDDDDYSGIDDDSDDTPLPVVIWHGLGDVFNSDGMKNVAALIENTHPGTYVFSIQLGNDANTDRSASFLGNVEDQLATVCAQLKKDPILSTAPMIDAIGFSQGGQFLRAYVEKCNDPPVRNLITFGSQHNGISKFQECESLTDLVCQGANALLRTGTVWSSFVQTRLVPAQYFRDPDDLDNYLASSNFLADANNERALKNTTYADNLASLEKFVLLMFEDDETVIPKQSSWFGELDSETGQVTELRDLPIYKEDWIGLKALDKKGGLIFDTIKGSHMQLAEHDLKKLFDTYFGPLEHEETKASPWQEDLEVDPLSEIMYIIEDMEADTPWTTDGIFMD